MSLLRSLALLLVPLALVSLGSGCTTLRALSGDITKPDFTFKRVKLQGMSFDSVTLGLVYEIDNPYEIPIELAQVSYQLAVEGNRVFSGSPNEGVKIPARRSKEITFPAQIRFAEIFPAAKSIFTQDRLDYRASGKVGIDTPVGMLAFPLSKSGTFDRPDLPKVRIADIRAPRITASGAELRVALDVTNTNPFPMPLESVQYGLALAGSKVGGGSVRGADVAAGKTKRLELPVRVSLSGAGRSLQNLLAGKATEVELDGKFDFGGISGPLDVARKMTLGD
ncbi:LEA type 2 family protein [Vulgatibacter sp.]|uniref:LEA type 2 family protein n=1 Tax=Vulgatibacter sp. TaxID=1971226 RepID=UPI0035638BFF